MNENIEDQLLLKNDVLVIRYFNNIIDNNNKSNIISRYTKAISALNEIVDIKDINEDLIVAATGERVIIVMGAISVLKSRVSEALTKYNSCIA